MPSPLLTTKLHAPPLRSNPVARPRLIERLNEGLARPLTLISAPPGFGKTTLVTAWLKQQPHPAAWLSLDERDNDLTRFLGYLVAALDTMQPEIGQPTLDTLRARPLPPLEEIVTQLSNDLVAIRPAFVLVLDDYHFVELQAIHDALAFLLQRPPPALHLVIATRVDPPLPLALLRARDQLVELRAPDLRFTRDETAAFLDQCMGLTITPEQIAALDARAEGWASGLQLAALSLQGRPDIGEFIQAFTGTHRFILDYLMDEVLQRQSADIQTFLLQTSILNQLNAELANAVTERTDGEQILAQIERANLFIVPLDDRRSWFRYHHLFAELLASRLRRLQPEQIPDLHGRASIWYAQNGSVTDAIDQALAVPDFDRAASLVAENGVTLFAHGEMATVLDRIAQLPDAMVWSRPYLNFLYAAALAQSGKIDRAVARLAQVDDTQLDPLLRALAAVLRAGSLINRTDLPRALEHARQMLVGIEMSSADRRDPQAGFNSVVYLYVTAALARLQIAAGQLREVAATCRRGLDIGRSFELVSPWAVFLELMHLMLANMLYEWNDTAGAAQHAELELEICQAEHNPGLESYALVTLAQIKQLDGDPSGAFDLVQRAAQLARQRGIASQIIHITARQVKVLLAQDRLEEAARVVSELPPEDPAAFDLVEPTSPAIPRVRVLLARREFDPAVERLERARQQAEAATQTRALIEILALLVLARRGQGAGTQARTVLVDALWRAEPEGYVRTFVDLGEPMQAALAEARMRMAEDPATRPLEAYADKLLAAFPAAGPTTALAPVQEPGHASGTARLIRQAPGVHSPTLAESLTERELAVLRLIADGLTNQEIADRLVVTRGTVKTHVYHIFGKLGVSSRTMALRRAGEFNLL